MNLWLLIPSIILLVLGITRGVRRDWRLSIVCLLLGGILFVIHHRQFVAGAKTRAQELAWARRQTTLHTAAPERNETSNFATKDNDGSKGR
ncbi:MAG: hypothetical protein WC708_05580 [Lentisphaeria bacterium]